jgi:hypothetical protein
VRPQKGRRARVTVPAPGASTKRQGQRETIPAGGGWLSDVERSHLEEQASGVILLWRDVNHADAHDRQVAQAEK